MIMMFTTRLVRLLTLAAPLVLTLQIEADAQGQPAPTPRALTYEQQQGKINAWTVGLAAGLIRAAAPGRGAAPGPTPSASAFALCPDQPALPSAPALSAAFSAATYPYQP